ncbi:hypothetical protein CKAN_01692600 [Cinnamomum micranthum f. kanehirae]|uniref:Uncharacterized protein n=1 Tax=Cinnamomum micranthum f. kanehirae TaxID=337451 RepID=A0A3S3QQ71_9MAGN|nr:hypothetical protein CKAN_01692600 [Cinnamomum micranthum f. kanehirae]
MRRTPPSPKKTFEQVTEMPNSRNRTEITKQKQITFPHKKRAATAFCALNLRVPEFPSNTQNEQKKTTVVYSLPSHPFSKLACNCKANAINCDAPLPIDCRDVVRAISRAAGDGAGLMVPGTFLSPSSSSSSSFFLLVQNRSKQHLGVFNSTRDKKVSKATVNF